MKIGNYELFAIETGQFALDGGAMFGVVPKVLWSKTNPADDRNRITLMMRALLIVSDGRKILVDTGAGTKLPAKFQEIYGIDNSQYSLVNSLRRYQVDVSDVTDVIITHLHFDHTGGATTLENGVVKPTFPNAIYYIQRKQFEWGLNPSERDKASFFAENFLPLQEAKQLQILEGECELFPGISLIVVNGHTPSQQLVKISGETTLVYCADLIPTSSHIPIPYVMGYDLYPLTTIEEKKKLLTQAEKEQWILYFEHDPFTEAVNLKMTDKGIAVDKRFSLSGIKSQ